MYFEKIPTTHFNHIKRIIANRSSINLVEVCMKNKKIFEMQYTSLITLIPSQTHK